MNESSNTPLVDNSIAQPEPFHKIWLKALTNPTEQTYLEIVNSPAASARTAYMWLAITHVIAFVVTVGLVFLATQLQYGGEFASNLGSVLAAIVCGAPIGAAIALLMYSIEVAVIQWVAKMFKGSGSFDKALYAFASFMAPLSLIWGLVGVLASIPLIGVCVSMFGIVFFFYSVYLFTVATKAVNGFGWGEAAGSVLLPTIVYVFLCSCVTIGILMALSPVIGDVFSTINSSLGY